MRSISPSPFYCIFELFLGIVFKTCSIDFDKASIISPFARQLKPSSLCMLIFSVFFQNYLTRCKKSDSKRDCLSSCSASRILSIYLPIGGSITLAIKAITLKYTLLIILPILDAILTTYRFYLGSANRELKQL